MTPPPAELRSLVDQLLNRQPLSHQEMTRLESLLEDDQNLAYYLDATQQDAVMPDALLRASVSTASVRSKLRVWQPWIATAAACLAFALGQWWGRNSAPSDNLTVKNPPAPARITGLMGVQWSNPSSAPDVMASAGALQQVAIDTGLVEVTYANGVKVTLEGPARFDVESGTSGRLFHGKLVSSVPKGAEGFQVAYHGGKVVDLGTEFAMEVKPGAAADIGVFEGEVELHTSNNDTMALFKDQAVRHDANDANEPIQAIPFDRDRFVRQLPSRDFSWSIGRHESTELVFDVSHLIWKPSDYRAIFKWINGVDGMEITQAELRHNGKIVGKDSHSGSTGVLARVRDNVFHLKVDAPFPGPGKWTLHVNVRPLPRIHELANFQGPVHSTGILQFEEGLVTHATANDFIGEWQYRHLGVSYAREFLPDGSVKFWRNGVHSTGNFIDSRWQVVDGVLEVTIPELKGVERHVLRDRNTLIFISQPYENAKRGDAPQVGS